MTHYSTVPWWLPQSDLEPMGQPELVRDLHQERQLGLHVRGANGASLGLVALRCTRHGETLTPLTLSIPESPVVRRCSRAIESTGLAKSAI